MVEVVVEVLVVEVLEVEVEEVVAVEDCIEVVGHLENNDLIEKVIKNFIYFFL